ncbi:hypothetical protein E2C01_036109 [Portunus trituberculatus]|uniref:Uncharacterized protein n=1 Tax=Portunus trituberculatus TaxID=210409 RepID=A0A5B7FAB8_PORTR|nr:hypothetical protein [Portunus trituberculatus]
MMWSLTPLHHDRRLTPLHHYRRLTLMNHNRSLTPLHHNRSCERRCQQPMMFHTSLSHFTTRNGFRHSSQASTTTGQRRLTTPSNKSHNGLPRLQRTLRTNHFCGTKKFR